VTVGGDAMQALFVHPNFYSQFSQLAWYLAVERGWHCTVVSNLDVDHDHLPFNHLAYRVRPGPLPKTPQPMRSLQDKLDHMLAVYRALADTPQVQPDVVVGHTGFGTGLYLRQLYDCAFVGYFEWYPGRFWTDDVVRRADYPPTAETRLGMATHHALTLTQLLAMDAIYAPTAFQRGTLPAQLDVAVEVLFDGVDSEQYRPLDPAPERRFRGVEIPAGKRVITYVSPGLEATRGFDHFLRAVKRLGERRDDLVVLVAGEPRTLYGQEMSHIQAPSFRDHVVAGLGGIPPGVHFLGMVPFAELNTLFNLSDVHVYLTADYTLSWSMVQAMSAGCALVASDTAPVHEFVAHGREGLLAPFADDAAIAASIARLLDDRDLAASLGRTARERVQRDYSNRVCLPRLADFLESTVTHYRSGHP